MENPESPPDMSESIRDIEFRIVDTIEAFSQICKSWNELVRRSQTNCLFLSWEWMFCWWEIYGELDRENSLFIITAYDQHNGLVGVLPLFKKEVRLGRFIKWDQLQFLGTEIESSDYLGFIVAPDYEHNLPLMLLKFLYGHSYKGKGDIWEFGNILEDAPSNKDIFHFASLKRLMLKTRRFRSCPYLLLDSDYEAIIGSLSSNMRYNLRRRTRNLFRKFNTEFCIVENPSEVEASIDILFELHHKRWATRSEQTGFVPERKAFHKRIGKILSEHGVVRLFMLKVDARPIAILYCFIWKGDMLYYQAGFDPDWDKQSPGLVLMGLCIQYAIENRLKLFDFMRGGESYKSKWTQTAKHMMVYQLGISKKGKVLLRISIVIDTLKQMVKRFVPPSIWHRFRMALQREANCFFVA